MKRVIRSSVFVFLLLTACTRGGSNMTPVKYIKYMENPKNEYSRTVITRNIEYNIQLATSEYMAIKDCSDKSGNVDIHSIKERLNELSGYIFFIVRLKRKLNTGVSEELVAKADAERMVMYYNSSASQDITMQADGMSFSPASYLFENNYSLVSYNSIIAGFKLPDSAEYIEMIFNDRYNNNSFIKTKFSQEELSQLPSLIY